MENALTQKFWDEHFIGKSREELQSKIKRQVYDWLNGDNLGCFGTNGDIFWIEKVASTCTLPNYIREYIIRWAKRNGYRYLYNIS